MPADALFSSNSELHYTPAAIADAARELFGGIIDLDPASDYAANQTIRAQRYYIDPHTPDVSELLRDPAMAGRDGLTQSWKCDSGFLNPPFTVQKRDQNGIEILNQKTNKPIRERVIDRWVARWIEAVTPAFEYRSAPPYNLEPVAAMRSGILLIPARTDTEWFDPLWGFAMCFIAGRVRYGDAKAGAPFPSVIVYAGRDVPAFYRLFNQFGRCGTFE